MRHNRERGALALYAGKSEQEALEAAGLVYSPANGRRFRNSPDVRDRLRHLFEADRPFLVLDALRARREREALAFSNIKNYLTPVLDGEGKPTGEMAIKDITALPDDLTKAIKKIKPTKLGYEIELYDKDASLRAIEARVDPVGADHREASSEDRPAPAYDANDNWSELTTQQPLPN